MFSPRIGFFWDVDECPTPDGSGPCSVYESIISALEYEGYNVSIGHLQIAAYDEKNTLPEADMLTPIMHLTEYGGGGKYERMFKDMVFWAMFNQAPANVIVVSKNISENKDLVSVLKSLQLRDYTIALAHSVLPTPTSVWLSREALPGEVEVRPIFPSRNLGSPQSPA